MLLSWRLAINALFEAETPSARPRRDLGKFDLGVCPGCRGLRAVASPQCTTCGSAAKVAADA
jgi:hypothetical protein